MQRAEGFGQSPPYVIQGGPSEGDKGPGDRDDGLQGHRTSKQHYRGRENRRPPSSQITGMILDTGAYFSSYLNEWTFVLITRQTTYKASFYLNQEATSQDSLAAMINSVFLF